MEDYAKAPYADISDEALVKSANQGDTQALDALIKRYEKIVKIRSRAYYLIGGDVDDLIQEGLIGLYKAVKDYKDIKNSSFESFAKLCITRQILTAIKSASRQKHLPLNSYISINKPFCENEGDRALSDLGTFGLGVSDPEEVFIGKEDIELLEYTIEKMLSGLEKKVFNLYVSGKTYVEIADLLNKPVKSVDNAIQRIRRKLGNLLKRE